MPAQDSRARFPLDYLGVDPRALEHERARDERNSGDFTSPFSSLQSRSLPPPMAMSLRTRESSSLALKHIFDQMNSSTEAVQTLDPLQASRGAPVLEKREDDGKHEGPGSAKDSGVGTSTEMVLDNLQRTGAGVVPNPSAQAFKRYSNGRDDEAKGLQVSRRAFPPTEGAHVKSPAGSPSEKDLSFGSWNSERSVSPALQQAGGNAQHTQLEHLRNRLPDFDVSFRNPQTQSRPFPHQSALGTPISTPSRPSPADLGTPASSPALRASPQAFLPRAAFRPGMSNSLSRQPTAQLTIFYSGTVNVYDDVPADKAHAIMLLAGNGNSWSSNFESAPLLDRERTPQVASASAVATSPAAPLSVAVPAGVASVGTATVNTRAVTFGSPAPSMPPTLAIPPAVASPAITVDAKTQTAAKRPHAGIELPHARKASLARFLEKRKDRVQLKPQGNVANESEEKADASSEEPCTPTKKQRNARSRSSSPS